MAPSSPDDVRRAVLAEGYVGKLLVLHVDNDSVQMGSTLRAELEALEALKVFAPYIRRT